MHDVQGRLATPNATVTSPHATVKVYQPPSGAKTPRWSIEATTECGMEELKDLIDRVRTALDHATRSPD